MTVTAPPRPRTADVREHDELEALIEEARRRARRRRMLYASGALVAVLGGVMVLAGFQRERSSQSASADPSARANGPAEAAATKIMFARLPAYHPGPGAVYVVNADGSGERRLAGANVGTWSPDGELMAVALTRDGNQDIYLMDSGGTILRRLTHDAAHDGDTHWSVDGREIYFLRWTRVPRRTGPASSVPGRFTINVVNADGSGERRLTQEVTSEYGVAWSADARRIAFTRLREGNHDVYVMNTDGSGLRNLTPSRADEWVGSWSPDGSELTFSVADSAFVTPGMSVTSAISVVNADGSGRRKLAGDAALGSTTAWSPDGSTIAFVADRDGDHGKREIVVINADGSGRRVLVRDSGKTDPYVTWSPDGSMIAFTGARDGNSELYVVNADGSALRRLTRHPEWDANPVWIPSPKR